jgi:hypothetical protein
VTHPPLPGYMAATPSRAYNSSYAPRSPAAQPPPDDQVFGVDFTLAEARSRLAALDFPSAAGPSPSAARALSPAAPPPSDPVPAAAAAASAAELPRAAAPSVSDVRRDMAAKRRLALLQAAHNV